MNILVFMSFLEVVCGLTTGQYWKKTTKDVCYLVESGNSAVRSASLLARLTSAMMENRTLVSYNQVSDIDTANNGTPVQNTQHDVYIHVHDADPNDCTDVNPIFCSGVYRVTPTPGTSFDVYCDMDTPGGPWTVMHNRQNQDVDFYRNWAEYKAGFGDLLGNFWLGNDKLHVLTSFPSSLRIELEAWDATAKYAEYSEFQIANESDNYRILVQGFSGTTIDNLYHINGRQFTTWDRDNDGLSTENCAVYRHGAWWHRKCTKANLNGEYSEDNGESITSMYWREFVWNRYYMPLKKARMLAKRKP